MITIEELKNLKEGDTFYLVLENNITTYDLYLLDNGDAEFAFSTVRSYKFKSYEIDEFGVINIHTSRNILYCKRELTEIYLSRDEAINAAKMNAKILGHKLIKEINSLINYIKEVSIDD